MAAVRCVFLFNVSHLSESRERREEYSRLLYSCSFRLLSFFYFGAPMGSDRASRVSWAWRFCDWSRPARRIGREASSFQAFNLDEFETLEERLKEELVEHVEDSNAVEHVGTVRDLSLALTELTGSLPWDLPELRSPTKSHCGSKQRVESKYIDAETRNYIFVLQPCPRTDSQWNRFCEGSVNVLKTGLFPPALYTQLHDLKQIAVHWVNTTLSPLAQVEFQLCSALCSLEYGLALKADL